MFLRSWSFNLLRTISNIPNRFIHFEWSNAKQVTSKGHLNDNQYYFYVKTFKSQIQWWSSLSIVIVIDFRISILSALCSEFPALFSIFDQFYCFFSIIIFLFFSSFFQVSNFYCMTANNRKQKRLVYLFLISLHASDFGWIFINDLNNW